MPAKDPLYLPAPFFMVRLAALPVQTYFELVSEQDWAGCLLNYYHKSPFLREAIAIASPSLYDSLNSVERKGADERAAVLLSLFRYVNRMSCRCTPFGLFSFVSKGTWSEVAPNPKADWVDSENFQKRARPDMEWLLKVVDLLCEQEDCFSSLKVKTNPLATKEGDRIVLDYILYKEFKELPRNKSEQTSIRASSLILALLEIAKNPVSIEDLKQDIMDRFSGLDPIKIAGMIQKLVQQQFLITHLHPSLLTSKPFQALLSKLSYQGPLSLIEQQLNAYNSCYGPQGETRLLELQHQMNNVVSSKNCIQVDAALTQDNLTLPPEIAKDLIEAAELLWKLPFRSYGEAIKPYHNKFLEKYGTDRIVPLKELLNRNAGLGVPEGYDTELPKSSLNEEQKKWQKWLQNAWLCCINENKKELVILEESITSFFSQQKKETRALPSCEIFFQIFAESFPEVSQGNYLAYFSSLSWQAGSTFGRFLDLMDETTKSDVCQLLKQELSLEKDTLFVEASYTPLFPHSANVATQDAYRDYQLDLYAFDDPSLTLDDIYVGATSENLYLTNRDGSNRILVGALNMLNPNLSPAPLRLIREVSRSQYDLLCPFLWEDLEDAPYLPRVRFKKVILCPAQWRVDLHKLGLSTRSSLAEIEVNFLKWAEKWEMPLFFYMGIEDQKILLKRTYPLHLREISSRLRKGEQIRLTEKIGQERGEWVQSQKGMHAVEFVLPVLRNTAYISPPYPISKPTTVPTEVRWKLPGSDWLFIKLYLTEELHNYFLIHHLSPLITYLSEQSIIDEWFFIRYLDTRPHLRVRFKGKKEKMYQALIPLLHDWTHSLLAEKLIAEVSFSSYEREIERYGGMELIDLAESFFCADSNATLATLENIVKTNIASPESSLLPLSLIDLLHGYGLSVKDQLALFNSMNLDRNHLKGFRTLKNQLLSQARRIFEQDLPEPLTILNTRKTALQLYANKIKATNHKTLENSILVSLMHMHCNRLIGCNSQKENQAYLYAAQILNILIYIGLPSQIDPSVLEQALS